MPPCRFAMEPRSALAFRVAGAFVRLSALRRPSACPEPTAATRLLSEAYLFLPVGSQWSRAAAEKRLCRRSEGQRFAFRGDQNLRVGLQASETDSSNLLGRLASPTSQG